MGKLDKHPNREVKRDRNRARRDAGETGRGARGVALSPVQKVLLGGGILRSLKPVGGDRKPPPQPKRGGRR